MPDDNEAEVYFRQLLIETKLRIIKIIRNNGGKMAQDILLGQLHEFIAVNPGLARMARDSYEDAWLFVFGALIQLMSEGTIIFDEENKKYSIKAE